MKKTTSVSLIIALLFSLISAELLAQVAFRKIPLSKQIDKSSLVIEGKVVSKESFWNSEHDNIYTINKIEVYKVFKGIQLRTVEIVTPGGTVGDQSQIVTPSLKLNINDVGVFTLHDANVIIDSKNKSIIKKFKAYSSLQGYYGYNLKNNTAKNPFGAKLGITSAFYDEIMSYTKRGYVEMTGFNVDNKISISSQNRSVLAPPTTITFDLTTATAGTEDVLTITGAGFGGTKGKVGFRDADSGGNDGPPSFNPVYVDALDSQVLTWSDIQITVQIPSGAGTGDIRVTHDDTSEGFSSATLTITYALLNSEDSEDAVMTQLFDDDGGGDITWQMNTSFDANTLAKAAFLRAFEIWRCETGVNWVVGANVSISKSAIDDVSIVTFDTALDPLPEGVLGRCSSVVSSCGGVRDIVGELDIVFDDDINDPVTPATESWNFSAGLPGFSEYDFESVALHELGHGHQLGHVIDPVSDGDNMDDVMHYAISNGEAQRVLSSGNISAAGVIQTLSTTTTICGQARTTTYSCPLSVEDEELNNSISLYPNPTQSVFYINNDSFINLEKAVVYDVSGRLINAYDISNTSRIKTINMLGMSKGVYFVNIYSDSAMITRKMVLN